MPARRPAPRYPRICARVGIARARRHRCPRLPASDQPTPVNLGGLGSGVSCRGGGGRGSAAASVTCGSTATTATSDGITAGCASVRIPWSSSPQRPFAVGNTPSSSAASSGKQIGHPHVAWPPRASQWQTCSAGPNTTRAYAGAAEPNATSIATRSVNARRRRKTRLRAVSRMLHGVPGPRTS